MQETDLFQPVAAHFAELGYDISAEVNHCDIVARKDEELVVIELKNSLNLTLLRQAVDRQSITNTVYVAIPKPAKNSKHFRGSVKVIKRLGLGLITVSKTPLRTIANIIHEPAHSGKINTKRRNALIKEIDGRSVQINIGGSTKIPVYTAYREIAITIAVTLQLGGAQRVAQIRQIAGPKTLTILSKNHYGWFTKIRRGVYDLSEDGGQVPQEYPELTELTIAKLKELDFKVD